jgi:DNA repair exonuclease SbcCD ATPase subunit
MIDIPSKAKVHIHWKVSPYDYSKEKCNSLQAKASKKYGIQKDRIKIIPEFILLNEKGENVSMNNDVIQNIQDPQFQQKLFKDYLEINKITDCNLDLIYQIDSEINAKIDYKVYDKYKKYSIKWIKWDNFLSYGENNFFDFTTIKNMVLLNGEPANQSGKTTFAIDLLHFLLFGKTTKVSTQDKIFNKHIPSATNVVVEGCINIDGTDYIIKRTLSRPQLSKRTSKSKTTQKVEYYKIVGDTKESLEDYTDNQQEENSIQTNKAIKEAIGNENDFDLIMSITESTLDDLVNKKESERGRLLSRWIGLLPIEEKDVLAREKFNSEIKPSLLSNQYDTEALLQEISAYELSIKNLAESSQKLSVDNSKLSDEIMQLERNKAALLQSKTAIDDTLLKVDITTLKNKLERAILEGQNKNSEIQTINDEINSIGDIDFSIENYDNLQKQLRETENQLAICGSEYKNIHHNITHLKSSEFCPTCGKKLDNVDNSSKIQELETQLRQIEQDGKNKRVIADKLKQEIDSQKTNMELFNKKAQLSLKKSALEVNVERLRNEYKDMLSLKKEYEKNSESIDKNNDLDLQIRNTDVFIREKRNISEMNTRNIASNESDTRNYQEQIENRKIIIEKIKNEEEFIKNWKIYLELVGKNGITKMVLRKTLPIINARLSQLLNDICDFDVEVGINAKNDVMFYLIKDGVYSDLSSGSGFELTASALALRAVLAEMSTISKCNCLVMDEVLGRVAKENYDNIKHLFDKILKNYDFILNITHLDDFKDFCDYHITVQKDGNISKICLK